MTPDQRALVDVVRETFGEPEDLQFPEVWGPRVVVGATTPAGAVFAKAAGDADVRAEVTTIALAATAGVPVPRVVLQTARSSLDALVEAGHTTDTFRTTAMKVFEDATPTITQGTLAHGDLSESETFVDPNSGLVRGIVDWGAAIVADPVFGLATVSAGGPADDPGPKLVLPILLDHYLPETSMDRAPVDRTLPLYQAHNAISNAEWSSREGVPWTDGLLAAADTWLRAV